MKILFSIVLFVFITNIIFSQSCNCRENLTFVQNHVEENYPGFNDKVTTKNIKQYEIFKGIKLKEAEKIKVDTSCINLIYQYLSYFKDGHIQVFGRFGPVPNTFLYPNLHTHNLDYTPYSIEFNRLTAQTSYLRIGTFSERAYNQIDSIINNNQALMAQTENMIIDLRGNEGGSIFTYNPLLPYIYTDTLRFVGFDVYATTQNILAYERQLESPYIPDNQKYYIQRNYINLHPTFFTFLL